METAGRYKDKTHYTHTHSHTATTYFINTKQWAQKNIRGQEKKREKASSAATAVLLNSDSEIFRRALSNQAHN